MKKINVDIVQIFMNNCKLNYSILLMVLLKKENVLINQN